MINLLKARWNALESTPYIMVVDDYELWTDNNMGYGSTFIYGEALMDDGTVIPYYSESEYREACPGFFRVYLCQYRKISELYRCVCEE